MKKIATFISVMAMVLLGLCGCGECDPEGNVDVQLNEIEAYSNDSADDIEINNISINLDKWNEDEVL